MLMQDCPLNISLCQKVKKRVMVRGIMTHTLLYREIGADRGARIIERNEGFRSSNIKLCIRTRPCQHNGTKLSNFYAMFGFCT